VVAAPAGGLDCGLAAAAAASVPRHQHTERDRAGAGSNTGITAHGDHVIAWSRYPTDLAHNFVLADSQCNGATIKKRDLPACEHLARWAERNAEYGAQIERELTGRGVVAELAASNRVT